MTTLKVSLTALTLATCSSLPALATDVNILTPYMSSIPTNDMVQAFKTEGEARGWNVTVIDTRNDFAQLASRMEDTVNAKADAIVLVSTTAELIADQVALAADAGIPVISLDGAKAENVAVNVTSNNFDLGVQLSEALFTALDGKGNIVKFFHSAHPGVYQRELGLDATLARYPDINVIAEHFVQVPGPVDNGRVAMENILRQYGDQIDGVWAAFDDPGIGAELAFEAEAPESKAIIMGIDGNEQAVDMIESCTHYKMSLRQDFAGMAQIGAQQLETILAGGTAESDEIYVAAVPITVESLGVDCK
ncbi:sugar ABC transporter substrate-binding protein [Pacificibacter marinus]|uniref:D-ribose-binding periplasmic protein n=1 Tax=Pacificibacter marinus TaxID=658057 RepID=A0A1Y5RDI4_9RHOB|nr:sugar ABC transporter substrate-binding protein [Pacificibacter marinus]SEK22829.1 monosaccharide ABC transporter substrate-binding protein, CUT2 family [Pacificibacter marinus]SLN14877.1 D-ribose-binding periplasmic protein precursor [Pacificibacter marinus]